MTQSNGNSKGCDRTFHFHLLKINIGLCCQPVLDWIGLLLFLFWTRLLLGFVVEIVTEAALNFSVTFTFHFMILFI